MKPSEFAVFYKIATNTVCRIEHHDRIGDFQQVKPARGERMLKISYTNRANLPHILRGLGIKS